MSSQAVKTCCCNIHLADSKGDRSLKIFVCDTASAMKYQRDINFFMDFLKNIKSKCRCYRIITMCITDGNCKCINACLSCINNCIVRICAANSMITASIFTSTYQAKLCLYSCTILLRLLHNSLHFCNIFLKRKRGSIQHYRSKSKLQSLINSLKSKTVIQVDSHIHLSLFCSLYHHRSHQMKRGILKTNLCNLEDDRCFQLLSSTDRTFHHFHITNAESTTSNIFLLGTLQQIFHFYKCHDDPPVLFIVHCLQKKRCPRTYGRYRFFRLIFIY